MDIGTKIKNAREDADLSQNDMAKLIPINQSNYSKIERGLQEPNMFQLKRICEILKIDPKYLLGLDEFEFLSVKDLQLLVAIKNIIKDYSV